MDDGLSFKDAKIFPGGGLEWDWLETGTRHVPGIQPADVQELIDRGAKTVILSRGVWKRLEVCPEMLDLLAKNGIAAEGCRPKRPSNTSTTCARALFHSTC